MAGLLGVAPVFDGENLQLLPIFSYRSPGNFDISFSEFFRNGVVAERSVLLFVLDHFPDNGLDRLRRHGILAFSWDSR